MLRERNDHTLRCGQFTNSIAAVDSLAVHALMRMHTAGKHFLAKHGWRSPFHIFKGLQSAVPLLTYKNIIAHTGQFVQTNLQNYT